MVLKGLKPDLTIYLDIDPVIGLERAKGRGELDRIEQEAIEFFQRTRMRYIELANDDDSIKTVDANQSIDNPLHQAISDALTSQDAEEIGSVVGTAARCSQSLSQACNSIDAAMKLASNQEGHEFIAAELRVVAQCLGEVTGAVYTDDILDRVFGRFCIGK